ncbi:hypothetical protein PQX77_018384 [Marasmius sp. AFHP31]|nr:hypothetical protein PQX77_018384 [Marasmius sp. AFHP31]
MPSTPSSPSAFTPDDHIQEFLKALEDFGFGLASSLLSYPGFANLLYSTPFDNLLRHFPPQNLSDHSLSVLVHMVTNKTTLKDLSDRELVPSFVKLLAKMLEHMVQHEEKNKPAHTRWFLLSSQPGPSPLQEPIVAQITTVHPTFTLNHSVLSTDDNSAIPSEFPPPSTICTHPGVVPVIPHRSHRPQLVPTSNMVPALSALPRANRSLIDPGSAINSQVTQCGTIHTSLSSGSLSPNNTSLSHATIGQSNGLVIRSYPTLSRVNYKPHSGATQRSPQPEPQQGVLDNQDYVPGGIDQHDNDQRGSHHDGLPYLQRAAHATVDSTLPPSAFIPECFTFPPSQTPYGSLCSIEGSTFLPACNTLEPASSSNTFPASSTLPRVNRPLIHPVEPA